jgi:hypothetical protein
MAVIEKTVEPGRSLDREQLMDMITTMGGVGSIELKVSVPGQQRTGLAALNLDFLTAKIREVYFFDTPDLTLFEHGVVPRARRTQGAPDDTVVKLRPAVMDDLPPAERDSPNMKVEMDITRSGYVVSASLKGERPIGSVHEMTSGARPLEKLFTKEQRAFFANHGPADVGWGDLVTLGPVYVVVMKFVPKDFGHKMVIEQWHYPGEVPLVELSTKATPQDLLSVLPRATAFLKAHGLSASGEQEPKTRKALEFFAKQLTKTGS